MKITIPLINPAFDDVRLSDEVKKDFDNHCNIYIYKDEASFVDDEQHAYSIWVQYGIENKEKQLMFDVNLDDLELFAHTLTKSIKMFRRDYKTEISDKIAKGISL